MDIKALLKKYSVETFSCFFILIISFLIFRLFAYLGTSDVRGHVEFTQMALNGQRYPPPNFLYYLVIYIVSGFNNNADALLSASITVLSFSMVFKFVVTKKIISESVQGGEIPGDSRLNNCIILISSLLFFSFSLPVGENYYLGQIPPNIWHNSTFVFLMPFSLLLFWISYNYLLTPTKKALFFICLLVVVNIIIKPSFFFSFAVVFPIISLLKFRFSREFFIHIIPVILGSIFLYIEYLLIYRYGNLIVFGGKSGISIKFLQEWSHFSNNILLSLLGSVVFPAIFIFFYNKDIKNNLFLKYSIGLFLVSIVICSFFSETGPREFHGNFFWQAFISNYLLFLSIMIVFLNVLLKKRKFDAKDKIIMLSFLLHVVSGFTYLIKVAVSGDAM